MNLMKHANNALDIYNQYGPAQTNPMTGALPQFDPTQGGTPLDVPAPKKAVSNPAVDAWTSAPPDPVFGAPPSEPPVKGIPTYWETFKHYGYNNPVWRAARGIGRFADAASNPTNADRPLMAGVDAMMGGNNNNNTAAAGEQNTPPPSTASTSAKNDFNFDPQMAAYGLGGAGVGALLGAATGRKGTRGRNALIGAGLGGGAGLLAQYLMNKQKTASEKQANFSTGMKNFAIDMAQAQGALRGQMLGLGGGGGLGGLAGALYGAYNPGAKAVLDKDGNPVVKRRSRLMGALRGGVSGAALGAGVGNFAGSHLGGMYGKHVALQELKKQSAFDFGKTLGDIGTYAKDMYNKVPESVRSGVGMGGIGGAALGGLAGLVAPGEDVEYDHAGNVIKRNPRNRFGAMLRGAVGGGLAGAGAGAAAGHFAPQQTQQVANYLQQQGHDLHQRYQYLMRPPTAGVSGGVSA